MFCYLLLCDLLVFINYKDIAAKFLPNLLLSSDAINLLFIYWDFLIIFFTLIAEALNFYLDFALKANIESVVCLQTHCCLFFWCTRRIFLVQPHCFYLPVARFKACCYRGYKKDLQTSINLSIFWASP